MTRMTLAVIACALIAELGGCATHSTLPAASVKPIATKAIAANRAKDAVVGKSTKADVIAAFGESLVISFDSGYEVWVYRLDSDAPETAGPWLRRKREPDGAAEFVILFAPSGLVAKARIRPAPQPKNV